MQAIVTTCLSIYIAYSWEIYLSLLAQAFTLPFDVWDDPLFRKYILEQTRNENGSLFYEEWFIRPSKEIIDILHPNSLDSDEAEQSTEMEPTCQGIRLSILCSFVKNKKFEKFNINDVFSRSKSNKMSGVSIDGTIGIIRDLVGPTSSAVEHILNKYSDEAGQWIGTAECFVSNFSEMSLEELILLLYEQFHPRGEDPFIWLDLFCLTPQQLPKRNTTGFFIPFETAINSISNTIAILPTMNQLSECWMRVWCMLEMFYSHDYHRQHHFMIALTPDQGNKIIKEISQHFKIKPEQTVEQMVMQLYYEIHYDNPKFHNDQSLSLDDWHTVRERIVERSHCPEELDYFVFQAYLRAIHEFLLNNILQNRLGKEEQHDWTNLRVQLEALLK